MLITCQASYHPSNHQLETEIATFKVWFVLSGYLAFPEPEFKDQRQEKINVQASKGCMPAGVDNVEAHFVLLCPGHVKIFHPQRGMSAENLFKCRTVKHFFLFSLSFIVEVKNVTHKLIMKGDVRHRNVNIVRSNLEIYVFS